MDKIVICYSPGARGDFLAMVLLDEILSAPTFVSSPPPEKYQKIDHNDIDKLDRILPNYYSIKINISSVKDFFYSWLLTLEKNKDFYLKHQPDNLKNIYNSCGNVYNHMVKQDQLISSFNFSDSFDFSNFNNIEKIQELYYNFKNQHLSNKHVDYILENNQLQDSFIHDKMQSDPLLTKTLDLLEFEVGISSVRRGRKFKFDEYLQSADYKDYLISDNYQ